MNTYINTKTLPERLGSQRGAMFGLDARLALAIFAGLSVIAGMAVFDTIRQTDVTALVSEFDNISKGYINYTFDTGTDIAAEAAGDGTGFKGLFEPTGTGAGGDPTPLGWSGPYITRSTSDHPKFGEYKIDFGPIDTAVADPVAASDTDLMGAWLSLTSVPCEVAGDIDEELDGKSGSFDTGNFRFKDPCAKGDSSEVFYLLSRSM